MSLEQEISRLNTNLELLIAQWKKGELQVVLSPVPLPEAIPVDTPENKSEPAKKSGGRRAASKEESKAVPKEESKAVPKEESKAVPKEKPEAPKEESKAVPKEKPEAPKEELETVPSVEVLRAALTDVMEAKGEDRAVDILYRVGNAQIVSEVAEHNRAAVIEACKKALASV